MRKIFLLVAMLAAGVAYAQERGELNPLNTFSADECVSRAGHEHEVRGMRYVNREGGYWRQMNRQYIYVGTVVQSSFDRAFNDGPPLTANSKHGWGANFTFGTSYILHRKPVWNRVHFGVDATWVDVNYAKGRTIRLNGGKGKTHQLDLAMGVGPAVHFDAGGDWMVEAHLRYNPTFATYYNEAEDWDDVRLGYASMWTGGASASWRRLSLGVEARFGRGSYHTPDWELNSPPFKVPAPNDTRSVVAQHPGGVPGGPGSGSGENPIAGTTDDRVMKLRTIGARVYVGLRF